ncbi:MAG: 3'-5' exonuclease domain-containing protein 2 [Muribaculaceae bacterium]|nr:3'-5' exonuclease domain-containing protein 2 [Muribaculaceae bacterium]
MESTVNENPGEEYHLSISKEELAKLQPAHFKGVIHVIDKEEDVAGAIQVLRSSSVIGFDTETRPSFKKGLTHIVSLLQLSTREDAFLFRLNKIGMPKALKDLIEDENALKVGLSIHDDFHNLSRLCEITPKGFIDLQEYVQKWNISDISLTKISAIVLGKRISKGQRLTNWEADTLTSHQQEYASLDALACIWIYEKLRDGEFKPEESIYYHINEKSETSEESKEA